MGRLNSTSSHGNSVMFFKKQENFVSESLSDFLFQSDPSIQIFFLDNNSHFSIQFFCDHSKVINSLHL